MTSKTTRKLMMFDCTSEPEFAALIDARAASLQVTKSKYFRDLVAVDLDVDLLKSRARPPDPHMHGPPLIALRFQALGMEKNVRGLTSLSKSPQHTDVLTGLGETIRTGILTPINRALADTDPPHLYADALERMIEITTNHAGSLNSKCRAAHTAKDIRQASGLSKDIDLVIELIKKEFISW